MNSSVRKRIKSVLLKFKSAITHAMEMRASEAETVAHIRLFLYEAMGYDFVREISSEEKIQGHFCDLAIKLNEPKSKTNERVQYLIEVKPAKTKLNDDHIFQAKAYGINSHIDWIVLTNGACWKIYKLNRNPKKGEKDETLVADVDIMDQSFRFEDEEPFFDALSREGLLDGARERLYDMAMENIGLNNALSPSALASIVVGDDVVRCIRREVRKRTGILIPVDKVAEILRRDVIQKGLCSSERRQQSDNAVHKAKKPNDFEWKLGVYRISGRGICAEGELTESGFVVKSGTMVAKDAVSSFYGSDKKKRDELMANGTIADSRFTSDYTFRSPSQAGGVIMGRGINARTEFKFVQASRKST